VTCLRVRWRWAPDVGAAERADDEGHIGRVLRGAGVDHEIRASGPNARILVAKDVGDAARDVEDLVVATVSEKRRGPIKVRVWEEPDAGAA
jgi:hypothetical protein